MGDKLAVGGPLLSHPRVYREALAVHEALRRLGFVAEEIFVAEGADGVHVVLRHAGKEFRVTLGPSSPPFEEFAQRWPRAVRDYNAASDAALQALWEDSEVSLRLAHFVIAMEVKGILVMGRPAPEPTRGLERQEPS
jgi:hypothetical protein